MEFSGETLDDLMRDVFKALLAVDGRVSATRGDSAEIIGMHLHLTNPRARLSHTDRKGRIFSGLGEWLWYLSGTDDLEFVSYYLPGYKDESVDGETVHGAYGPRLFNMRGHDQLANVRATLSKNEGTSRRAVVQLFNAEDIAERHKEIPCTCTLQFIKRVGRLHMNACMRSNDAFVGLPHDVFSFTMLQEMMARSLGCDVGEYFHYVASMHLYDDHRGKAEQYVTEGLQPTQNVAMPAMPEKDPDVAIRRLGDIETRLRNGEQLSIGDYDLDEYWADLARLLQIFRLSKDRDASGVKAVYEQMASRVYDEYIDRRRDICDSVETDTN